MTDALQDLDDELKDIVEDEITEEDFGAIEDDEREEAEALDDEPPPEPEPEPKPVIEDVDPEAVKAAEIAAQWQAYLDAKEQELAAVRAQMVEADDLDKPAAERVQLQERMAEALVDVRDAKAKTQQALTYHQQVSAPKPEPMRQWVARNAAYRADPAFKQRVDRLAHQLHDQEGLNPAHARFYQELDKRLMAKKSMGKPGKQGGAPVRRTGQSTPTKDQPTDFDRRWMPKIGLNPTKKEHLAEWRHHAAELVREGR